MDPTQGLTKRHCRQGEVMKSALSALVLIMAAGVLVYALKADNELLAWLSSIVGIVGGLFTVAQPALNHLIKKLPASRSEKRDEKLRQLESNVSSLGHAMTNNLMEFRITKSISDRIYGNTAYDLLYD